MKKVLLLLLILCSGWIFSQNVPKREFRGAWIATVGRLDWPAYTNPDKQKEELVNLLDELKSAGINAVMFQVRSECDAMYNSSFEPWSYWLTGSQGTPPNPYYDPLEFAIEEAHKRGMELHAWFNPYRAERSVGHYSLAANHPIVSHPEWIIQTGNIKILDPGIPAVREYVKNVIMDVVTRYDVDGVHFDDYFYPYPPNQITTQDDNTFNLYGGGFSDRGDWRRNNVNTLIQMIHDDIEAVKPRVKFGISPFGIWRPGNPQGIAGMDAYNTIYCDALAWLNAKSIDYLTPQLYWIIGGSQDYSKLMPWWADRLNGRHLYPGQAPYRILQDNWSANELPRQIRLNRNEPNCDGSVFFRAKNISANPKGFTDSLVNNYYRYPSLMPAMTWKDSIPPNKPLELIFDRIPGAGIAGLKWKEPAQAADGDTAWQYVVYNFYSGTGPIDFESAENIKAIAVTEGYIPPRVSELGSPKYFSVSALDRINNESAPTDLIKIPPPSVPSLALPSDGAKDLTDSLLFKWNYADNSSFYDLQISADPTFDSLDFEILSVQDTSLLITGLNGLTDYYWRTRSANAVGESVYSNSFVFSTGFPRTPEGVFPGDLALDVSIQPVFEWSPAPGADEYRFQLSKSLLFTEFSMVVDTAGLKDTLLSVPELEKNKIYFWRISADNQIGWSGWSVVYRFKTASVSEVVTDGTRPNDFKLYQNFPNPFNPTTKIRFSIPSEGFVSLVVYDILGRRVSELLNENLPSGTYTVDFNGNKLNSGVYLYVINFKGKREIGKMMLIE
jgi:uncharacterized lipoprotein YddW (UPF0748 family)